MTAGGHREIQLTQGRVALVDAEDFEWLSQWKWRVSNGYAVRHARKGEPRPAGKPVLMHREILRPVDGQHVDHINRCRHDNRRANLRLCTRAQNSVNRLAVSSCTGFRGVFIDRSSRHRHAIFCAQVKFAGVRHRLGRFSSAEEAARAYDEAARRIHGEFAILNFSEAA